MKCRSVISKATLSSERRLTKVKYSMNGPVEEWIAKSDDDFRVAEREFAVLNTPSYDAVCYHSQQSIEKLMKAVLIKNSTNPPRTHDLTILKDLIVVCQPEWSHPVEDLRFLTLAAVHYRYPGESADYEDASRALTVCRELRQKLFPLLKP
jgi:HEPN domain-containing protein